jgi:RNA polymerase sigma-70 factor (ECF subfamily)
MTTRWSVVLGAADENEPRAREALAVLCHTYWYPLYTFVRRSGVAAVDAEDVVQGFFARLLESRDLARIAPERGRFRAFLLAAVKHHLANLRDRERALKRGAGRVHLWIDFAAAHERFAGEEARELAPERAFERAWALELVARAVAELERQYRASNRSELFDALKGELDGSGGSHAEIGVRLGLSAGAVKVAAHRLRARFRGTLRALVAETVEGEAEIEAELADLLAALSA